MNQKLDVGEVGSNKCLTQFLICTVVGDAYSIVAFVVPAAAYTYWVSKFATSTSSHYNWTLHQKAVSRLGACQPDTYVIGATRTEHWWIVTASKIAATLNSNYTSRLSDDSPCLLGSYRGPCWQAWCTCYQTACRLSELISALSMPQRFAMKNKDHA